MNVCVISGSANVGKTETMRLIDDIFKESNKYQLLYTSRTDKENDFESVYENDTNTIGLISIGDTKSAIEEAFNEIKKYNIDYLICTSRTRGETIEFIETLSSEVVRIFKPYFGKSNNYNNNMNSNFAQYIYNILFKLFN